MTLFGKINLPLFLKNLYVLSNTHIHYCSTCPQKVNNLITKHFEEITIPVPWGHVSGKWYGPKDKRPILGLHGWQDNAGTFDPLAPLLPAHVPFLSIDLPGHGLSSWLPPGIAYHSVDYVMLLRRLMEEFNWDKISILAHSMSSFNAFIFSALFPDKVDLYIALDTLKPPTCCAPNIVDNLKERLGNVTAIECRIRSGRESPCYEWDKLVEKLYYGSNKSVTLEACKFLLQRNTKPSIHESNKYYFSRDIRLKNLLFCTFSLEVSLEMAARIKCPHLFIKAKQAPYYEHKEYYDATLEVLKRNPFFEHYEVNGTHHVHLNEPEQVIPIINPFINRYRPT